MMGDCGCGDFIPYKSFKINDKTLTIEIYRGCQDCGTGISFNLHFLNEKGAKDFFADEKAEDIKFDEYGNAQNFPLIGVEDLLETVKKLELNNLIKDYNSLSDFLHDYGLQLLQESLQHRLEKTEK